MVIGKCTEVFRGIFVWFEGGEKLKGEGLGGRIFSWRNFSWGKIISMKGVQDFLALFKKNNEKTNMKSFFN